MGSRSTHAKISLFSATALSATAMVGSGWLFSAQLNAKIAGNYSFLAWILAALLVMAVDYVSHKLHQFTRFVEQLLALAPYHTIAFWYAFCFCQLVWINVTIGTEAPATTVIFSCCN